LLVVLQEVLLETVLDALALLVSHRLQDVGKDAVLGVWMVQQAQIGILCVLCVLCLLDYIHQDPRAISEEGHELILLEDLGQRIEDEILQHPLEDLSSVCFTARPHEVEKSNFIHDKVKIVFQNGFELFTRCLDIILVDLLQILPQEGPEGLEKLLR
jgi:hypothetical protein